jgi:hypothetical protein
MRTTLDIDETLLRGAQARFAAGTPKTVIIEEALRLLIEHPKGTRAPESESPQHASDPRWTRLIRQRLVSQATEFGPVPPVTTPAIPLAQLLEDLDADRTDR